AATAPVLATAAVAIRATMGGPVTFRQDRVGRDGRIFRIWKLRAMRAPTPGAPPEPDHARITPLGAFLRASSIDELPQLVNVLRGDMSLVGPRPALPHEVAEFDDELLGRHRVQPGITGLWQVEARDKPDFEIYRRLDLFYVDNWSIGLDLAIMFSTVCSVLGRLVPHRHAEAPAPAVDLTESVA
ncbi:MAG: sugar transferase, partial [Leifsonia sp.]